MLYYAGRAPGLAEAFTAEVEGAIASIQTSPRARAANARGTRRFLLRRFPYGVHYGIEQGSALEGEELIVIYAVRHTRRDPDSWQHRVPPHVGND
ncbi:MAG: type II toxin-antitoxin system RelE/ParE family toxin [Verrucomicrobia bacterium]|nr:type II toxin-antitoxin system RelE/ParE family toxin [Verrucomicrobiota bacterium]